MIRRTLQRLLGAETRASGWDTALAPDQWLTPRANPGSGGVESNVPVALACVGLQSTVLAGLPFAAYRRLPDGGRERIRDGSLARLINAPNAFQSRFDFVEAIVRALHFQGNAFFEARYGRDGLFESLVPLADGAVTVEQTRSGAVRLKVSEPGNLRTLVQGEFLHVRMPGNTATDLRGVSTVQRARGALGLNMALNNVAAEFAQNGMRPAFVTTHPGKLSPSAHNNMRRWIEENIGTGRPLVLSEDVKTQSLTLSLEDAELLASRQFGAQDTARIFLTPPSLVGLQQTSAYGSQQQDSLNFVQTCIGPLANRIEESFGRCLLSDELRQTVFFEFDLNGLLRADPSERFRQYEIGRRIGLYNPNDLLRLENMPPRSDPGGNEYGMPSKAAPEAAPEPTASVKP